MAKEHQYTLSVVWEGNKGEGTSGYRSYSRDHSISIAGKPVLHGSSDPNFRGDPSKYNPEELFVASLSACHMLWYLHLCADAGIIVEEYSDDATGTMQEDDVRGGFFKEVLLKPHVMLRDGSRISEALRLHHDAHRLCFIANSCNFPVRNEPSVLART